MTNTSIDISQFKGTQFNATPDKVSIPRRVVMAITGKYGSGKTHLACTAPGAIAYYNFDKGDEGVVDKAIAAGKVIYKINYPVPEALKKQGDAEAIKAAASDIWAKHDADYETSFRAGFATDIVDTATEQYELLRLARFGKTEQVNKYAYGPVNAEYRRFIRRALDNSSTNLILLHRTKKTYVNDSWNGHYERAGFGDLGFIVQIELESHYDVEKKEFYATVVRSRHNPSIIGQSFRGPMCTFPIIAASTFPGTTPMDWGMEL